MAVNYYKDKSQDSITLTELELYHLIMKYRKDNDLPAIPLSKGLTITAGRHALDTVENMGTYSGHNWSDATYPPNENMWLAPARIGTSYQGEGIEFRGYEISTAWSNPISPQQALKNWQESSPHNAVILNLVYEFSNWTDNIWKAIGVGMLDGIAHVWFGEAVDPGGFPKIVGTGGNDRIDGTRFKDNVAARGGSDKVAGGNGNDKLAGAGGDDRLDGGSGNDTLDGGNGGDVLKGGKGKDTLYGGKGADTNAGGSGADRFEYRKTGDSTVGSGGQDTIKDFKPGQKDRIDLKRIDADTTEGGNQAFTFVGKATFGGAAGELRYEKSGGDTFVYGDVNGDGAADFAIRLDASIDLAKADFVL